MSNLYYTEIEIPVSLEAGKDYEKFLGLYVCKEPKSIEFDDDKKKVNSSYIF